MPAVDSPRVVVPVGVVALAPVGRGRGDAGASGLATPLRDRPTTRPSPSGFSVTPGSVTSVREPGGFPAPRPPRDACAPDPLPALDIIAAGSGRSDGRRRWSFTLSGRRLFREDLT